jgi:hypothetical protein
MPLPWARGITVNQETVMNQTNENVVKDQDVIVLGVASVETQGGPIVPGEVFGEQAGMGIAGE